MKRSERRLKEKRRETAVFVLDENLSGHSIFSALRKKELPVYQQFDFAHRGATDPELVKALAKDSRRILITKDQDFRYKKELVNQLMKAGVRIFALTSAGNKRGDEIVEQITKAWPGIQRFINKHKAPFVAKVSSASVITMHRK